MRPWLAPAARQRLPAVSAPALVLGALVVAVLAASLAACTPTASLRVSDAPSATPPPRDAFLVEADWPAVAAWIGRENAEGRAVVVNFFASWCGPCRAEAPVFRAAAERYGDVAFLGVDYRDPRPAGEEFIAEEGIDFPTVWDFQGRLAEPVGARGMPATAFFDTEGRLVETHTGQLDADQLEQRIERVRS